MTWGLSFGSSAVASPNGFSHTQFADSPAVLSEKGRVNDELYGCCAPIIAIFRTRRSPPARSPKMMRPDEPIRRPAASQPSPPRERPSHQVSGHLHLLDQTLIDYEGWMAQAKRFHLNTDFVVDFPDLESCLQKDAHPWQTLRKHLMDQSATWSITALTDKLTLQDMLMHVDGIAQMDVLHGVALGSSRTQIRTEVKNSLGKLRRRGSPQIVLKPSHCSSGQGFRLIEAPYDDDAIADHLEECLSMRPFFALEGAAMRRLKPGAFMQLAYDTGDSLGFCDESPLEVRVWPLWGSACAAVWWMGNTGAKSKLNAFFLYHPDDGKWTISNLAELQDIACRSGDGLIDSPQKYLDTLAFIQRTLNDGKIKFSAETIATKIGAPLLRVDYFIGSPTFGVRLNEISYGTGGIRFSAHLEQAFANIFYRGMKANQRRSQPIEFLRNLGVKGSDYTNMRTLPKRQRSSLIAYGELDPRSARLNSGR